MVYPTSPPVVWINPKESVSVEVGVESWKPDDYRWKKKIPNVFHIIVLIQVIIPVPHTREWQKGHQLLLCPLLWCESYTFKKWTQKGQTQKEGQKAPTTLDWIVLNSVTLTCMEEHWRSENEDKIESRSLLLIVAHQTNDLSLLYQHLITCCHCLCCLNSFWQIMKNAEQTLYLMKPQKIMFSYWAFLWTVSLCGYVVFSLLVWSTWGFCSFLFKKKFCHCKDLWDCLEIKGYKNEPEPERMFPSREMMLKCLGITLTIFHEKENVFLTWNSNRGKNQVYQQCNSSAHSYLTLLPCISCQHHFTVKKGISKYSLC